MPIIKIVPMPGPSGTGGGVSSTAPFELNDTNDDLLLSITKSGTGTTRITAPQDDLALRSARDIILYPGDDGPGYVYVNWGDAEMTPDSDNRVATFGDLNENHGDITFDGVKIVGGGTASGDGYNNGTIQLVPDSDLYANDQYLIIDPTAPNHIHIRAGGTQDDSHADLILGGERNNVYIEDDARQVTISTRATRIQNTYQNVNQENSASLVVAMPVDIPEGSSVGVGDTEYLVTGVTLDSPDTGFATITATGASFVSGTSYTFIYDPETDNAWQFTSEASIHFPYGPSNARTGYGDVLRFATSFDQSIITGAAATIANPTANRLVVAGQDGAAGNGYDGEGGDVYLWAGRGGGTNGGGGDIKIDGGNGAPGGQGGYVKVRGGYSQDSTGGYVYIDGGSSANSYGGNVEINAGDNYNDTDAYGGSVNIHGGSSGDAAKGGDITLTTSQYGKVILLGDGGEYINSAQPENQIATLGDFGIYPRVLATDGSPLTGSLSNVGKMLYANLTETASEFVVPTNASVAFPIGSEIKFATSDESPWHISAADYEATTIWGEGSNYSWSNQTPFIVPINSTATLLKVDTDKWILSGLRLTD